MTARRTGWIAAALILAVHAGAQEPAPTAAPAPERDERHVTLRGGGELIGRVVKETSQALFVDLGPTIVTLPMDSVLSNKSLEEAAADKAASPLGLGSGVYDEATGSVVFRSREGGGKALTKTEIVDNAKRSVVLISNPSGAGSGWFLDDEGRIVSNHHVINGEKYHTVNVFKKRGGQWERVKFENVEVEAYSPLYDISILKLDLDEAKEKGVEIVPLPIAAPGSLQVGDTVYAIGNPGMGGRLLEHSVSEGIASSLARNFGDIIYIQTTAAVNPGNSGGPLVNDRGEVVGLVTLKATFQEGIAFALPVPLIRHFLTTSESFAYSEQARNKGFRYLSPQ